MCVRYILNAVSEGMRQYNFMGETEITFCEKVP